MNLADVLTIVADRPVVELAPGDRILTEGERSSSLFVLVDGDLEVRRSGWSLVHIGEPGAIVGELGLLLDQPATADVVAVAPTQVHRIDDGEQLFEETPELMAVLARILARRLSQVTSYLTDLQIQFADRSETLGLVPTVLRELLDGTGTDLDPGSEREADSPY